MFIVILISSIYAFLETSITGYIEYTQNNNKKTGIVDTVSVFFVSR